MRNFGFFVVVVSLALFLTVSAGTTKEHKKKLLEKLRAALNTSDSEAVAALDSVAELELPSPELEKNETKSEVEKTEVEVVELTTEEIKPETSTNSVSTSTNNYMANFRIVVKRLMELLGLRKEKKKEGRGNRMLEMENNDVDHVPVYREEVRATVGAVLGDKECIQKVACVAGSNLKTLKGKNIIFALLESFSPKKWRDMVRVAKQAAILGADCDYKCLEE